MYCLQGFDEDDDDEMGGSSSHGGGGRSPPLIGLKNPEERFCRNSSRDYQARFAGHCNTTTDIKEANFFGNEGQFIVAGSDDGTGHGELSYQYTYHKL